jgi:hypothetical protein
MQLIYEIIDIKRIKFNTSLLILVLVYTRKFKSLAYKILYNKIETVR